MNVSKTFCEDCQRFSKITYDFREGMFPSYSNTSEYFSSSYSNSNLKTGENNMLFLHMKISCLCPIFTGVYIINISSLRFPMNEPYTILRLTWETKG